MASIVKRGKKWAFRIKKYENGILIHDLSQSGFTTKKEAEIRAMQVELDIENGTLLKTNSDIFADYFENWMKLYKLDNEINRSNAFKRSCIKKCHLIFGKTKIKSMTRDYYQAIINQMAVTLSKASIKKYHVYFKACLNHAVEDNIIKVNPAEKIVIRGNTLRQKSIDDKYINLSDTKKLLSALLDKEYTPTQAGRNCCIIAIETGMRFSEIIALTWDRVDLDNQTILIDRSFDYHYGTGFKPTKNGVSRKITISAFLTSFLKDLYNTTQSDFVIGNYHDNRLSNNGANFALASACKRANIKKITMHALRHTHGSILLLKGFSIPYISKRLGHSSVTITQEVYLHILSELQEIEDDKIKNNFLTDTN